MPGFKIFALSTLTYRVSHKRRPVAQILKVDISIILLSLPSLSTSGKFLIFEKRASFLGNPVCKIDVRLLSSNTFLADNIVLIKIL